MGTPLMAAVAKNNLEGVKLLVNNEAKLDMREETGLTALGIAKLSEKKEIIEFLESSGAKE